jgi:hypothetical protein
VAGLTVSIQSALGLLFGLVTGVFKEFTGLFRHLIYFFTRTFRWTFALACTESERVHEHGKTSYKLFYFDP